MVHINLQKNEQLYFIPNDRVIVANSIDLDRKNHKVIIHKYSSDKEYDTHLVGCMNLDILDDKGCPIEEYDFINEF